MSVSNIASNVSALLNKAYNTDANAAAGVSQLAKESTSANESQATASASTQVSLGNSSGAAETYTAKGLMQQLRQYQLNNASLLFGNSDDTNEDSTGLTGLMATSASTDQQDENWVESISTNPDKAKVMVETSKSNSVNTMLNK